MASLHMLSFCLQDNFLDRGADDEENPHVIVPLRGRFKGETGELFHLLVLSSVTRSSLAPRRWIEALVQIRKRQGLTSGPAFCDNAGNLIKSKIYEVIILDAIELIQIRKPSLVGTEVKVHEEYGISRSFRRGATTTARNAGVSDGDVTLINRWRTVESAKGRKPNQRMIDHYSEIRLMIPSLIRFSRAL